MMTPAAPERTHQGAAVRTVLLAYIAAAAWTAAGLTDTPWFVLHAAGAIAGACALGQAVSLAGLAGAAQRELYGPLPETPEEEW